jgi:nucleotide-binding universal stress UspA family protein
MTAVKRRSYEQGHRPKWLVYADETPECDGAVQFAARRAARVGGALTLVAVIQPDNYGSWLGVGDRIRAEAQEDAESVLEKRAAHARAVSGLEPERKVREGARLSEIVKLIEEDEDISYFVVAAGVGADGPGPLVSALAKGLADFPIPIVIIPGGLTEAEIEAMS